MRAKWKKKRMRRLKRSAPTHREERSDRERAMRAKWKKKRMRRLKRKRRKMRQRSK